MCLAARIVWTLIFTGAILALTWATQGESHLQLGELIMLKDLFGVSVGGSFFSIDPDNGHGTLIGPVGFQPLTALAVDNRQNLYCSDYFQLIRMNPFTGAGTAIANPDSGGARFILGLAFSSNNVLYGLRTAGDVIVVVVNGVPQGPYDQLVTFNLSTGVSTLVGSTHQSGLRGLAFSPQGVLYSWNPVSGLVSLDLTTGLASTADLFAQPIPDISALTFRPGDTLGHLYGARNDHLFSIDVMPAKATLIGSGGYSDICGLAFRYQPLITYPHPPWLWMMVLGVGALVLGGIGAWRDLSKRNR